MRLPERWTWMCASYDLTKAVFVVWQAGWRLRTAVWSIGPLAFCIVWRVRREDEG